MSTKRSSSQLHLARRGLLPTLLLGLCAAAPAGAAWRELPTYEVPRDDSATCLRDVSGGTLTALGRGSSIDLLTVGADGLTAGANVALGRMPFCPEAAGAGDQQPLIAGAVAPGHGKIVEAPLRPFVGGPGAAPAPLAARGGTSVAPAVAVAPNGAAVSAWVERRGKVYDDKAAVTVALRAPGATAFGPARQLGLTDGSAEAPRVAIDAAGRAHVAWAEGSRALVASAAPGAARFGAPQPIGGSAYATTAVVAAAPGGRALAVVSDDESVGLIVWELAPGGRRFTRAQRVAGVSGDELTAAVRDDGGAAVLTRDGLEGVTLLRRAPGGRFGRATALHTPGERPVGLISELSIISYGTRPVESRPRPPALLLAPSGELVATWSGSPQLPRETRAYAWHGRLDGPTGDANGIALGSPCRTATSVTPLLLPDGRVAVAWADDGRSLGGDFLTAGTGDGAIHVALPAERSETPPPAKPRPRVTLLGGSGRVGPETSLRLRVDCGAAGCDVLASAPAVAFAERSRDSALVTATAPGAAGREVVVRLEPSPTMAFAQHDARRRVPVTVTACTRDGGAATTIVRVARTLRGRALSPQPRIADLRARRVGGDRVRVTWRQTRPTGRGGSTMVMTLDRRGRGVGYSDRAVRSGARYSAVVRPARDLALGGGRAVRVKLFLSTAEQMAAAAASTPIR